MKFVALVGICTLCCVFVHFTESLEFPVNSKLRTLHAEAESSLKVVRQVTSGASSLIPSPIVTTVQAGAQWFDFWTGFWMFFIGIFSNIGLFFSQIIWGGTKAFMNTLIPGARR